ncbi:hypothetical protein HanIR_Chr12g0610961 [Helianthus annuus]|nr:hypothetical protein HanIR_Chr12g0610961 [Helianthus annuus]
MVTNFTLIYIFCKYLGKIIGGAILYNFNIFGRKIGNYTLLTETLEGAGAPPVTY